MEELEVVSLSSFGIPRLQIFVRAFLCDCATYCDSGRSCAGATRAPVSRIIRGGPSVGSQVPCYICEVGEKTWDETHVQSKLLHILDSRLCLVSLYG
jgi:hypothetical protein